MARFLTTTDTSAAIERVIREAEKELTLISAYVYPRIIYLDRLRDAARRGVAIQLIFGKRRMDDDVMAQFREIPNLRIHYLHELHAKCYFNEREAVITSLNLLNSSEAKNREMGVLLSRSDDASAYQECVHEATSILARATPLTAPRKQAPASRLQPVHPPKRSPIGAFVHGFMAGMRDNAFCIRCAGRVPFDPLKPLCPSCFSQWAEWRNEDYREAHCHNCGVNRQTSFAKPLCAACYRKS